MKKKNISRRETFIYRGQRRNAFCTWFNCKHKAGWRKTDPTTYRALCAEHAIAHSIMPCNNEDVEPLPDDVVIEGEFNYKPQRQ